MNIESLNIEIINRANEKINETLAYFFEKLYKSLVAKNQIATGSYSDSLLKEYFSDLYLYVDSKIKLHKIRKRYYFDEQFNYYNCDLDDRQLRTVDQEILFRFNNVKKYKQLKDLKKEELFKNNIRIPKTNYPFGAFNLPLKNEF